MPKLLTKLRIREVSSVDRGAGEGVKIMLMKREDGDEPYWKREFSEEQRRRAASSGAAESDGSFPIENAGDLHNAMRAIGRSKNPSKTRAHIRARARALGLTSELSDAFKREEPMSAIGRIFGKLFGRGDSNSVIIDKSLEGLAESVGSILSDDGEDVEKVAALTKTFEQFGDHLKSTLTAGVAVDKRGESDMDLSVLRKALGLADTATEADVTAAIAKNVAVQTEMAKGLKSVQRELKLAKAGLTEAELDFYKKSEYDEEEDTDDEPKANERGSSAKERGGEERAGRLKKAQEFLSSSHEERTKLMRGAEPTQPEWVRKMQEDNADLRKQLAKLTESLGLTDFQKKATAIGLPEADGITLQKAYAGDREAVDKLVKMVQSAIQAAASGEVFKEFGSSRGETISDDPNSQLMAKAAELRKSDPKLSEAQAFEKVYSDPANVKLVQAERDKNRPRAA